MTRRRNQFARVLAASTVAHQAFGAHATRREGDEMACRCGKRWSIGENHP